MSIFHRTIKFVMSKRNHTVERTNSNNERNRTQKQISISQNNTTHLLSQEHAYTTIILSRCNNKKKQQTIISTSI